MNLDSFLLPGQVFIVLGEDSYQYLVDKYKISGVITGFETAELLSGIYKAIDLVLNEQAAIVNNHPTIVTKTGNRFIHQWLEKYLQKCDEAWWGIGVNPNSGLDLAHGDGGNLSHRFIRY